MSMQSAEEKVGGWRLEGPEDMPPFMDALQDTIRAEGRGAYLVAEPQDAADLTYTNAAATPQVRAAWRTLQKDRVPDDQYMALDGGNGVNARRAVTASQMAVEDAAVRALIKKWSSGELRKYLQGHATAAEMWAALPLYFGGPSQEAQMNVKDEIKAYEYKFDTNGKGAMTLMSKMVSLSERLVQSGGTRSDADTMQDALSKFVLMKDGNDLYSSTTTFLLKDLNDGSLTTAKLRSALIAAEKRQETKGAAREVAADGAAMVTSSGARSAFTPAQLAELAGLREEFKEQGQTMATRIEKGFKSLQKGLKREDKKARQKSDKPCFVFRDTGECKRGDECRFAH